MKARERLRAARKAALAVTAAGVLAATGGGVAEAATSSNLLYSTDGGASWSSSATVAPGQTVLVRQWYDNDTAASETGASLTTTIPGPFTLNGGTTEVCLNPSTTNPSAPDDTELVCESSAEGAVWSGKDLQVSPTAGHYGESNGSTSGVLAFGRKRYLNMQQCVYVRTDSGELFTAALPVGYPNTHAFSEVSNVPATALDCANTNPNFPLQEVRSGFQAFDLLGNRYLNMQQCLYQRTGEQLTTFLPVGYPNTHAFSEMSNVPATALDCSLTNPNFPLQEVRSGFYAFDLLGNRYLNMQQCVYERPGEILPAFLPVGYPNTHAFSEASNVPATALDCSTTNPNFPLQPARSGFQAFDLLDTARGHGYVQYAISAPDDLDAFCASAPVNPLEESYTQDGSLTSTPSGAKASSGDLTIVWGDDPANPPCESSIPMIDPQVGAVVAGLTVVAGAAYVLHRRRRVATI